MHCADGLPGASTVKQCETFVELCTHKLPHQPWPRGCPCSSPDVGLLSPGHPTPFPVLEGPRNLTAGMAWCLHNNIWGEGANWWKPCQGPSSCQSMLTHPRTPICLSVLNHALPSCTGTNYPMWYPFSPEDATMRFRFVLRLDQPAGRRPAPLWLPMASVRGMGLLILACLVGLLAINGSKRFMHRASLAQ